jgi:hypothetical protein
MERSAFLDRRRGALFAPLDHDAGPGAFQNVNLDWVRGPLVRTYRTRGPLTQRPLQCELRRLGLTAFVAATY